MTFEERVDELLNEFNKELTVGQRLVIADQVKRWHYDDKKVLARAKVQIAFEVVEIQDDVEAHLETQAKEIVEKKP